jgi:hypothetical protein
MAAQSPWPVIHAEREALADDLAALTMSSGAGRAAFARLASGMAADPVSRRPAAGTSPAPPGGTSPAPPAGTSPAPPAGYSGTPLPRKRRELR